ncbi:MAG: hypothetical protein N2572_07425 [Syntrophales bacterium]|nr:hypothetical protein [Syntrophales bacterium]
MNGKKGLLAVKFCGGCNPTYERGMFFEDLKTKLEDKFDFVPHDHPTPDGMIIICGCDRVCPIKQYNPCHYKSFTVIRRATASEEAAAEIIKQHS